MRHQRTVLSVLILLLSAASVVCASTPLVMDSRSERLPYLDVQWTSPMFPEITPDGASEPIALPFPFEWEGRTYRSVVVGEDGWLGLLPARPDGTEDGVSPRFPSPWGDLAPRPSGPPQPQAFLDVLRRDWSPTASGRIQVQATDRAFVVRWVRVASPEGSALATFEAILHPEGFLSLQYLEVRDPRAILENAGVGLRETRREVDLMAEGHEPAPGVRVVLRPGLEDFETFIDGDCADFDGDGAPDNMAPPWCQTVNPPSGAVCTEQAGVLDGCGGQPGGFDQTDCSDCAQEVADSWHFHETSADGCFCKGCQYTFYILVECGTEMHMPFYDMEGARVRVFDAVTGDPLGVTGQNDCFKDPFLYCNGCNAISGNLGIIPESVTSDAFGVTCDQAIAQDPGITKTPCEPYNVTTTPAAPEVSWGAPNPPPCTTNGTQCPGGTGSNLAHELTNTDVVLENTDGLCGVFRVEVESGGCLWDLFANCDGSSTPEFSVFRDCQDALQAWNPLPEYIIEDVRPAGDCPSGAGDPSRPSVEVELRNVGCCDTTGNPDSTLCPNPVPDIPVTIRYVDPDDPATVVCPGPGPNGEFTITYDPAQLAQQSGSTQVLAHDYPCDFSTLPARALVTLDPEATPGDGGLVAECSEDPDASSCGTIDVAEAELPICTCEFFVQPDLQLPQSSCIDDGGTPTDPVDDTATLTLDASASSFAPDCVDAGGNPAAEYRFYRVDPVTGQRLDPDPLNADLTDPVLTDYTFPCQDQEDYAFEVEVSCSAETIDPANCPQSVILDGFCNLGDALRIGSQPDGDGNPNTEEICRDGQIELQARFDGNVPLNDVFWTSDPPGAMDGCDCDFDQACDADMSCGPLPESLSCGDTVTFTARSVNQDACEVVDTFTVSFANQGVIPVGCSLKVERASAGQDLLFRYSPISFRCPAAPSEEIVEYPCTGPGYTTCPNGNPPGTGPFDVSNMEADGTVLVSGDRPDVPLLAVGAGEASGNRLTYYQARSIVSCSDNQADVAGPLGLPNPPGPFNCP